MRIEQPGVSPGIRHSLFYLVTIIILIVIQFQNIVGVPVKVQRPELSHIIFIADKILFIALFLILFYSRLAKGFILQKDNAEPSHVFIPVLKSEIILSIFLCLFTLWCLISAAFNYNSITVSLSGIFSYIVYFSVFFVFSSFFWTDKLIHKIYIFLLRTAIFLSVVSICQEAFALIYPHSAEWWPNIQKGGAIWRMNLFRAPSLLGHPNNIGLFALFFWTMELARRKNEGVKNNLRLIILALAIFFSMSRSAIGASMIAFFLVSRKTRQMILLSLPAIILFVSTLLIVYPGKISEMNVVAKSSAYDEYRSYTRKKSLEIFGDHPFFGVGPGMYGGHVSLKYDSPVYKEYGFEGHDYEYLHDRVGSIEQLWLQVLAELGVPGFLCLILLFLSPVFILSGMSKRSDRDATKSLIAGLKLMPFQMFFYMLGFTVSQTQEWLIPFFAFSGMIVGNQRRRAIDERSQD
jgi:O-antigen ligase